MSDIRLIMIGSVILFVGLILAGMAGSKYSQISIQQEQFGDCYDYSSGNPIYVNCTNAEDQALLYLAFALGLMGGGSYIIFRGIKGSWDQNVKSDEMLGPKHG